jgi:ATP-dependent Clp protease adaptor protein ClpS
MLKAEEILEPAGIDTANEGFSLILFNDSHHEFEEVINQVMKATGYGYEKAETITLEAHNRGRALVLTGAIEKCLSAQSILEEINLRTSIEVNV